MLCGYLKQTCKSITVKEFIELLSLCKNQDALVKCNDTTGFFIHFDQEGQFVNISKSPYANQYGNNGSNDTCESCNRYDSMSKCCRCNGNNCLNADMIINTRKFNEVRSREDEDSTDTKNTTPTKEIKTNKYDLSNISINGIALDSNNDQQVKTTDKVEEKKEEVPEKKAKMYIQDMVDDAIIKTLNKMINGIKVKGE